MGGPADLNNNQNGTQNENETEINTDIEINTDSNTEINTDNNISNTGNSEKSPIDLEFKEFTDKVKERDQKREDLLFNDPKRKLQQKQIEAQQSLKGRLGKEKNYLNDDERYEKKFILQDLYAKYSELLNRIGNDDAIKRDTEMQKNVIAFKKILDNLKSYSEMDVTHAFFNTEGRLYDAVLDGLTDLDKAIQEQYKHRRGDDKAFNDMMLMSTNLLTYFQYMRNGDLEPVPDDKITVNTSGVKIKTDVLDVNISNKNVP